MSPRRSHASDLARANPDRTAFTLVELLVVIGIIALLISILLPTLGKVREHSQAVACRSNLQQIWLATKMYANDYRDRFPEKSAAGSGSFRRGAGEIGIENSMGQGGTFVSSTKEEIYGLPALYARYKYIPGVGRSTRDVKATEDSSGPAEGTGMVSHGNKVWVCPAAREFMKDYYNTYSWPNLGSSYTLGTSIKRAKLNSGVRNPSTTPWVLDNYASYPAETGNPSSGGSVISGLSAGTLDTFPHKYTSSTIPDPQTGASYSSYKKRAAQAVYFDGHVGYQIYYYQPPKVGVDSAQ